MITQTVQRAAGAASTPPNAREAGKALAALEWSRARHQLAEVRLELEAVERSPFYSPAELRELLHAYRSELHNLALAEDVARRRGSR